MSYNNFSDWYKKILINAENNIKTLWLKELMVEDVFLEIIKHSSGWVKEVLTLYWIDQKLVIEIIGKWVFNETLDKRKWAYIWMNGRLKNIILWSVKIAASYSKSKASIEDCVISMIQNDAWLKSFLDYIGITPSDLEVNIWDLNKLWVVDGFKPGSEQTISTWADESIDKLLGALTKKFILKYEWWRNDSFWSKCRSR